MREERVVGGRSLLTPHGPEAYPGLLVVRPSEAWPWIIVPDDGQAVDARGGEELRGYETAGGVVAGGFTLAPGDRAQVLRSGLEASLVEWRLLRA